MNVTVDSADLRALQERVEALEDLVEKAVASGGHIPDTWIRVARDLLEQSERWEPQERPEPVACPRCANENVRPLDTAEGVRFLYCSACGNTWEATSGQPA